MNRRNTRPAGAPENDISEYICPSASWGDMTGLILTDADNDSDPDSCKDVYPFMDGKK
ncbi:MAG: hypothetical protein IJK31_04105 [Ruminococcus sp.]|nr:hypothetical protein [Ruminococcus sp.]